VFNKIMELKNFTNTAVYVDYENIYELLKSYGKNPFDLDFFPVIIKKLKNEYRFKIIEFIVYSNFEKKEFHGKQQTLIQKLGIETRHSSNSGKNCSDLELTVDALRTLYKNPSVDVFVLISSDRDIIPLIKAIKYENKIAFTISTKNGFNSIVTKYTDYHEYIEDIFNISPKSELAAESPACLIAPNEIDSATVTEEDIERAKEVSKLLYESIVWKKNEPLNETVSLKGYVNILAKTIIRTQAQIFDDFKLAHSLQYVCIYNDPKKGLCLKEGSKRHELCEESVPQLI
jgi:uncharacterized LabA/DUF88 family protein